MYIGVRATHVAIVNFHSCGTIAGEGSTVHGQPSAGGSIFIQLVFQRLAICMRIKTSRRSDGVNTKDVEMK